MEVNAEKVIVVANDMPEEDNASDSDQNSTSEHMTSDLTNYEQATSDHSNYDQTDNNQGFKNNRNNNPFHPSAGKKRLEQLPENIRSILGLMPFNEASEILPFDKAFSYLSDYIFQENLQLQKSPTCNTEPEFYKVRWMGMVSEAMLKFKKSNFPGVSTHNIQHSDMVQELFHFFDQYHGRSVIDLIQMLTDIAQQRGLSSMQRADYGNKNASSQCKYDTTLYDRMVTLIKYCNKNAFASVEIIFYGNNEYHNRVSVPNLHSQNGKTVMPPGLPRQERRMDDFPSSDTMEHNVDASWQTRKGVVQQGEPTFDVSWQVRKGSVPERQPRVQPQGEEQRKFLPRQKFEQLEESEQVDRTRTQNDWQYRQTRFNQHKNQMPNQMMEQNDWQERQFHQNQYDNMDRYSAPRPERNDRMDNRVPYQKGSYHSSNQRGAYNAPMRTNYGSSDMERSSSTRGTYQPVHGQYQQNQYEENQFQNNYYPPNHPGKFNRQHYQRS